LKENTMSTKPGPVRGTMPWPTQSASQDQPEDLCARQRVTYTCDRGHTFEVVFAASAKVPAAWDCRCGKPAGLGHAAPTAESELQRCMGKVRQRRDDSELEQLLADRITERRLAL
jgi:RNA polymerase-binding protein